MNNGEYRFFPEVVLALNLTDGLSEFDKVNLFHSELRSGQTWNKSIGDFQFSISQNVTKNILNDYESVPKIEKINIAHLRFEEKKHEIIRIDGNHRLSAAEKVIEDFKVPFCLLLFQNPKENQQYSRAIFHNINAKQVPLNLEENLKVILEGKDVFNDDKLKRDPSFGWKYYLARKVAEKTDFSAYPFIQVLLNSNKYSYLIETFGMLLEHKLLKEEEKSVDVFVDELENIEVALKEAELHSVPKNVAVLGTLSFYKLESYEKYKSFIQWIKQNSIVDAPKIHMTDLISIYDKVFENTPKSIFVSMQFCDSTADTYQTIKDIRDAIKRESGVEINLIKVDEHHDGYSGDIYERIIEGIKKSALVIADLSYGNRNVHHEIGLAQGMGKKVLLLYKLRDAIDARQEIGSNISMYDQVRFKNQTELRPVLTKKIEQYFEIEKN